MKGLPSYVLTCAEINNGDYIQPERGAFMPQDLPWV